MLQALENEGIAPKRLVAVGRADLAPVASENGANGRGARRVTFEMLGAGD